MKEITRRDAIKKASGIVGSAFFMGGCQRNAETVTGMDDVTKGIEAITKKYQRNEILFSAEKPVVSIAVIPEKKSKSPGIDYAVREAIDLLGGIKKIAKQKEKILIKPNLVSDMTSDTTKPEVVEALVKLMKENGKDVIIGEGSAAAGKNIQLFTKGFACRTRDVEILHGIQDGVFDDLGYVELSKKMKVSLSNLHVGDMIKYSITDNFVFKDIYISKVLDDADLVCSVPMMKTHGFAGVTLGMKNFIGAYPGMVYGTVRSRVHQIASKIEPSGTASAIVDMVKACKIGLTVIDASTAMQGQGPYKLAGGELVEMNMIIAGTNALATDMVGAYIMGFEPEEISTFKWAWKSGMKPLNLDGIEIRGKKIDEVKQKFERPVIYPYKSVSPWYGPPC